MVSPHSLLRARGQKLRRARAKAARISQGSSRTLSPPERRALEEATKDRRLQVLLETPERPESKDLPIEDFRLLRSEGLYPVSKKRVPAVGLLLFLSTLSLVVGLDMDGPAHEESAAYEDLKNTHILEDFTRGFVTQEAPLLSSRRTDARSWVFLSGKAAGEAFYAPGADLTRDEAVALALKEKGTPPPSIVEKFGGEENFKRAAAASVNAQPSIFSPLSTLDSDFQLTDEYKLPFATPLDEALKRTFTSNPFTNETEKIALLAAGSVLMMETADLLITPRRRRRQEQAILQKKASKLNTYSPAVLETMDLLWRGNLSPKLRKECEAIVAAEVIPLTLGKGLSAPQLEALALKRREKRTRSLYTKSLRDTARRVAVLKTQQQTYLKTKRLTPYLSSVQDKVRGGQGGGRYTPVMPPGPLILELPLLATPEPRGE